jgi:1-deoxy-D-xylulose-5-phosphate reductoisomerase
MRAGRKGQTYPAALAAADEVAVSHFLDGRLRFSDIPALLEDVLAEHEPLPDTEIGNVLEADAWARARAEDWVRVRV